MSDLPSEGSNTSGDGSRRRRRVTPLNKDALDESKEKMWPNLSSSPLKDVESEGTESFSEDNIPYGTLTEGRHAERMGSTNVPFGTETSLRERTVEPYEPPQKAYRPTEPDYDPESSSSTSHGLSLASSSSEDTFDELQEMKEHPSTAPEPSDAPTITNSQKTTIFILMVVTQLVANFDSGALASIYGMKPQGDRVTCTAASGSFTCPSVLSNGATYPPTDVSPDVTQYLSLGNDTTRVLTCSQGSDIISCQNSTVQWTCSWVIGPYVSAISNDTYSCSFVNRDNLKQSLLHDPSFNELYRSKGLQGFLSSIVYLGLSLGAVLTGIGFRYFSPHRLLQVSLVFNGAFAFMFAQSVNRAMLFASRFLVGITQATLLVYAPVWVDAFAIPEYASLWMSLIQAAVPLGIVSGYICAGTLASGSSLKWSWSFYIQCVALAPCIVAQLFIPGKYMNIGCEEPEQSKLTEEELEKEEEKEDKERTSALKSVLSNPVVWLGILAVTSLYFVVTSMQLWITDYLTTEPAPVDIPGKTAQDRYSTIVIAFGITAITGPVMGVLIGGYILDSPKWVGGYADHPNKASFFSALAGTCAAVAAIMSLVMTKFWPFIIVIWFTLFFGGMVLPGLTGVIISSVAIEHRGVTSSFAGLMYNLFGYFAGPFVTGLVANKYGLKRGFQVALSWAAVAALLGIITWIVGLRKKFASGVAHVESIYCEGVARAVCGYKVLKAEEEEALPVLTIEKDNAGVPKLVTAEEGKAPELTPLVKLMLLLAEYSEDDPMDVVSLRRKSSDMYGPRVITGLAGSRNMIPPELEPLSEFFNTLDVHSRGVITLETLEIALRDKRSLGKRLKMLEGVEGEKVEDIAASFRGLFGITNPDVAITWKDFLDCGEVLIKFISIWRFKSLPQFYILAGFQNGTDKHVKLRRSERDGLPYWWGPVTEPPPEGSEEDGDDVKPKLTPAEQKKLDKKNAQIFLFSMFRGGRRGWMIGTPEDFVLRYHGYFIAAATNKFDLLASPHKQPQWTFINHVAEANHWQSTLRIVTTEAWAAEVAWKEKEERRPALGAAASVMGITTFFNRAHLGLGKSFLVTQKVKTEDRITPAELLKKLRGHFADSEITQKHDEDDVAKLYESKRSRKDLLASSVNDTTVAPTSPTATINIASPRIGTRRRSMLRHDHTSFRLPPVPFPAVTPPSPHITPQQNSTPAHGSLTPTGQSTIRTTMRPHVSFNLGSDGMVTPPHSNLE
eukprot:TRINITY_DN7272_c0_g1_i1.p1 TRINITY_DN7272_c0_g1~~TRINITY_DN7272_c0_g1_i1.p1  ORF type:complete len:1236 (+),score=383.42 TRINITY_DN7272_c0_g1_i1:151-3858(+)